MKVLVAVAVTAALVMSAIALMVSLSRPQTVQIEQPSTDFWDR
jgi:hypothetical protein